MTEFKLADWRSYYNPPDNTLHLIRYRGTDVSVCVTSSHNGYTVILDKEAFSNTAVVRVTLDKELSIEDTDFSREADNQRHHARTQIVASNSIRKACLARGRQTGGPHEI